MTSLSRKASPDHPDIAGVELPGNVEIPPGTPYLLIFYRGYWCRHCRTQLVELSRRASTFHQHGVSIVAISTDDATGISAMNDLIRSSFAIVPDSEAALISTLGLVDPYEQRQNPVSRPALFLVDATGVVRYHYIGSAPDDRPRTELLLLAAEQLAIRKC